MLRTVKQKLNLQTFVLVFLGVVATVAILVALSNMSTTQSALIELEQYQSKSEPLRASISSFSEGKLDKKALLEQLQALNETPSVQAHLFDEQTLSQIKTKVNELDALLQENKDIEAQVQTLTRQSIALSNGFLAFVSDKLLKERSAVSELEIKTIVGANTNTDMNYQIHNLFLKSILSSKTSADKLSSFIANSITNIEKDIQALANTEMANAPVESLEKVKAIQALSLQFLENSRQINSLDTALQQQIDLLVKQIKATSTKVTENSLASVSTLLTLIMVGLAAAILAIAVINYQVGRSILNPLNELGRTAETLANSGGDLTHRLVVHNDDEIGRVSGQFNAFLDAMHKIISTMKSVSGGVVTAASNIREMTTNINDDVGAQSNNMDATTQAIEEMGRAVEEVSQNANDTANSAQETDEQSQKGKIQLDQTLALILEMIGKMDESQQSTLSLDASVDKIGAILDNISSIADQTNLLALNAAIEAARAGEQGRGFSVVADEVRTLASRTQESLEQTRSIVAHLQSASQGSVALISETKESGTVVSHHADETSTVLETIRNMVGDISANNQQIAAAVEQQGNVTQGIKESMGVIQGTLDATLSKTEDVTNETKTLFEQSELLQGMLAKFKTS